MVDSTLGEISLEHPVNTEMYVRSGLREKSYRVELSTYHTQMGTLFS